MINFIKTAVFTIASYYTRFIAWITDFFAWPWGKTPKNSDPLANLRQNPCVIIPKKYQPSSQPSSKTPSPFSKQALKFNSSEAARKEIEETNQTNCKKYKSHL